MTCLHFSPSFCSAQVEGKCHCKHFCSLRGRSLSHLSPPRIQSKVTSSSMPPPLPYLIPFPHPHSMSSLAFPPTAFPCTVTHSHSQMHPMPSPCRAYTHVRTHIPWCFSWQILTNVLLVSVGVSFELNLYTSAPELTSIGFNSFNSHDICLLAYLLSKQAQAQLASWETLTLAFVSVREENVIACAKYKLKKNVQPWNTHRDGLKWMCFIYS